VNFDHTDRIATHSWIMVADSDFVPTRGGGEREHLGFVRAAVRARCLAAIVVPTDPTSFDRELYLSVAPDVPIVPTLRQRSPVRLLHPRYPFVVASRPYRPGLARVVAEVAPDATGVVTFSYKSRLVGAGLARDLHLPMILRQHNREGDYHRSLAAGSQGVRKVVTSWEAWRIARDERRFDRSPEVLAVADISADDAAARRAAGAPRVIHIPPFALDLDRPRINRHPTPGRRVLFLGALDVVTNRSALHWFVDVVWPIVRAENPDARLDIVGSRPPASLRQWIGKRPEIALHADVPDVAPFLANAAVAVNPAVVGSGVNIKLVEYLQGGVPVVSTHLATRGLSLRPGQDLEVHDEPARFAAAVSRLLTDPERAAELGESGRHRILELLDPQRSVQTLAAAFEGSYADSRPVKTDDGRS
jgi:glycosyltransferase involved in cell wall biosynthesis